MAIADMEVRVGADISGLLSKVDQAKAKIGQLTEEQGRLKSEIKNLNYSLRENDKEYGKLSVQLQKVNTRTKEGSIEAARLRKEMSGLLTANKEVTTSLKLHEKSLVNTNTELKSHTANLKKVEGASNKFVAGTGKAVGGLRLLANIIPGIGIAGLITMIAGPLIGAFKNWISAVDDLNAKQKLLKDINIEASKGASEQVTKLEILRQKITDLTKPLSERIRLAKEYNKISVEGNRINLEELGNITLINEQINKQIGLIKRQSLAKAAQSKVATFADRAIQAELDFQDALRESGVTEAQVDASREARAKSIDKAIENNLKSLDGFNNASQLKIKPIIADEGLKSVQLVDKKLEYLLQQKRSLGFELDRTIQSLLPQFSDDAFFTKDGAAKTGEKVKNLETVNDVLGKLAKQLDFLNQKEILTGIPQGQARIKAMEGTVDTLLSKFKLLADDPIVINLQARIDGIKADEFMREFTKKLQKEFKETKVDVPVDLNAQQPNVTFEPGWASEKVLKDQILKELKRRGITKTAPIQVGIDVEGNAIMAGGMLITGAEGWETLLNTLKASNEQFEKMIDITSGTLGPAFDALFTGILTGSQDAFRGFGEALNQTMVQIAAAILKAAALALILSSINPAGGGFGSIFKKLTGFKDGGHVKGFADGGHIKGPGTGRSDSIMARLSHGEYVIPAHIVSKFGVNFFDKIRKGMKPGFDQFGIPKFANGGFVSPNIIRTARAASISSGSIGGGQVIRVTGNFELRNDKLVAAVSRGRDKINRNS